ncbi:MAG: type II toxin-antitoxin system VapC family toxin [Anaerolineae bacterium]|nr:type II toxin-antitoxin system VapC family toxin [Anaerolineae bacterium]
MNIVIDANIALALVVPLPYSSLAAQRVKVWKETEAKILAPVLWGYEIVSELRKALVAQAISPAGASAGLQMLWALNIEQVMPTLALHQSALRWAERLGQRVVYDASYLALTEVLRGEFWTADQPLARNAQQMGEVWVRWIGEDGSRTEICNCSAFSWKCGKIRACV